jgi:pyrroline-5-carboxylate reductase
MNASIAFVGGGNMASSLIGGMIAASFEAGQILVSEPDTKTRKLLQERFRIQTTDDNSGTLGSDVVILAIKPQQLQSVCRQLASFKDKHVKNADHDPLFISIAAGVRSNDIDRWLGGTNAIVRCMPNTPSLFQSGATALYANNETTDTHKKLAENIMSSVGITAWVENENKLDAVTALSGSGPAYFFLLMEAMQIAGRELGLDENLAKKLTIQTALGAARMADASDDDVTTLRKHVTSKGGTTETAINCFENANFHQLVKKAMENARNRSVTLADELSKDQS